jgi:hypothetical protein
MRIVEKVANAIFENMPSDLIGEKTIERVRVSYGVAIASAAIEAMREPTDAMARKADGLTDLVGPYEEANTPEARQDEFKCAWRAMIDKAIQESGE